MQPPSSGGRANTQRCSPPAAGCEPIHSDAAPQQRGASQHIAMQPPSSGVRVQQSAVGGCKPPPGVRVQRAWLESQRRAPAALLGAQLDVRVARGAQQRQRRREECGQPQGEGAERGQ
eukprot:694798-Prymnesium_polylepis.1